MDARQKDILKAIVEEYIRTAEPVGSAFLAGRGFKLSPATIRKEMAALETEGLIMQPHTSAGRTPTESGFRYYVKHFLKEHELPDDKLAATIESVRAQHLDERTLLKKIAQMISALTNETVIIGFDPHDVYYTGISQLFQKPEFRQVECLTSLSTLVDRFNEIVANIFEKVEAAEVKIGSESFFGDSCAAILTKVNTKEQVRVIIILGSMRMHYERNLSLLKQIVQCIEAL